MSEHILREVAENLVAKFKAPADLANDIVAVFRRQGELIIPAEIPVDAFADADDLPVIGTAVAGHAEFLVTGDKGLLALESFEGVAIVTPREFYNRLHD